MAENEKSSGPISSFFRDKVAIITGASSGIGEDAALELGRLGARLVLLARRKRELEDLARKIKDGGGSALAIPCDVARKHDVEEAIGKVRHSFDRIDILVNSAGVLIPGPIEELADEDLHRMMTVNLYGALHVMQAVIPVMRRQGAGNIVNVASLAGRRGFSPLGGYSATKFALVGLTEALRMELFGSGIRVSLVMPGVIDTPMTSNAKMEEVLEEFPAFFGMPVRWVTWAILAAIAFGLTEVDVPPGAGIVEKMASLMPGVTDTVLSVGSSMARVAGRLLRGRPASEVKRGED